MANKLSEEKIKEIVDKVYDKALIFLSIKPRTISEVESRVGFYLNKFKSFPRSRKAQVIESIVKRLINAGLLDDEDYANKFIKEKIDSKKSLSKMEVKKFLLKKKIPSKFIEKALIKYSPDVEKEKLQFLAEKKWKATKNSGLNLRQRKTKVIVYLTRKGYSYNLTSAVVDSLSDVK